MAITKDVTKVMGASIPQESTGRAKLDFGESGKALGALFAGYQLEKLKEEYDNNLQTKVSALTDSLPVMDIPNYNVKVTEEKAPDLSWIRDEMVDTLDAKTSGAITDTEFKSRIRNIEQRAWDTEYVSPKDLDSIRGSIPGFEDVYKSTIGVTAYMKHDETINEEAAKETQRNISAGARIAPVGTPVEEQERLGAAWREMQMNIRVAQDAEGRVVSADSKAALKNEQSQNASIVATKIYSSAFNEAMQNGVSIAEAHDIGIAAANESLSGVISDPVILNEVIQGLQDTTKKTRDIYKDNQAAITALNNESTAAMLSSEKRAALQNDEQLRMYMVAKGLFGEDFFITHPELTEKMYDSLMNGGRLQTVIDASRSNTTAGATSPRQTFDKAIRNGLINVSRNPNVKDEVRYNADKAIADGEASMIRNADTTPANRDMLAKNSGTVAQDTYRAIIADKVTSGGTVSSIVKDNAITNYTRSMGAVLDMFTQNIKRSYQLGVNANTGALEIFDEDGRAMSLDVQDRGLFTRMLGSFFGTSESYMPEFFREITEWTPVLKELNLSPAEIRQVNQQVVNEFQGFRRTTMGDDLESAGNFIIDAAKKAPDVAGDVSYSLTTKPWTVSEDTYDFSPVERVIHEVARGYGSLPEDSLFTREDIKELSNVEPAEFRDKVESIFEDKFDNLSRDNQEELLVSAYDMAMKPNKTVTKFRDFLNSLKVERKAKVMKKLLKLYKKPK